MNNALKTRLLLAATGFIILALVVAAAGLSLLFERHVKSWIDTELNAHLDHLIAGIDKDAAGTLNVGTLPADPRFAEPFSGLYWQVKFQSGTETRSRSLWDYSISLPPEAGIDEKSHHHAVQGPKGQSLYLIQRNIELPARLGRSTALIAVARDEAEVNAAVWRFTKALLPFLAILGALLIGAAWLQVQVGLRPLASIRTKIADIQSGTNKRLGKDFPAEVQPLAREIDDLLDARDKQIETARNSAQDLAHGLKTPLQVISGGIEKLRAEGDSKIADDLEHSAHMMQRHVDRQLARARLQRGTTNAVANIKDTAERVVRVLERTPRGKELTWSIECSEKMTARIHQDDLSEALGGLAENAARHARTRIIISAQSENDGVRITVSDDGPGIPQDKFDEALQRGKRLDTTGSGSGLGLAIVSDIAEAWGGSIELSNNGGLFNVHLRFPHA